MFDDRDGIDTPDSVFPNNWISTHDDGRVVLYPMAAPSRRRERRGDVVEGLRERYGVSQVLDLSPVELEGRYLEGTGALVLDHVHRIAYMSRSGRANEAVLDQWCEAMGYTAEVFNTVDQAGQPIYHTNVVLSIATDFVVAGLSNIPDPVERARIAARLGETGRDVIEIDRGQVAEFAGNGLELTGSRGRIFRPACWRSPSQPSNDQGVRSAACWRGSTCRRANPTPRPPPPPNPAPPPAEKLAADTPPPSCRARRPLHKSARVWHAIGRPGDKRLGSLMR
jgi:hypothetical protein